MTSYHIIAYHSISYYIILYYTTLHYITLHYTILYYTIPSHTIPYYTILYSTMLFVCPELPGHLLCGLCLPCCRAFVHVLQWLAIAGECVLSHCTVCVATLLRRWPFSFRTALPLPSIPKNIRYWT